MNSIMKQEGQQQESTNNRYYPLAKEDGRCPTAVRKLLTLVSKTKYNRQGTSVLLRIKSMSRKAVASQFLETRLSILLDKATWPPWGLLRTERWARWPPDVPSNSTVLWLCKLYVELQKYHHWRIKLLRKPWNTRKFQTQVFQFHGRSNKELRGNNSYS